MDSKGGGRRCGSLEKLGKQTPICPLLLDAHVASGPWVAAPESGGAGGWSLQGRRPVWVQQPRLWVGGSPGTPVLLGIRVGLGMQLRGWGEPSGPHRLKLPRQGGGPPPGATQTFPCTCTHVGAHTCTMHTNAHKAHRHKHRHKAHVPTSTHGTRGHMQKAHTPTC